MQSINTALVLFTLLLVAVVPATIAVNHGELSAPFALFLWLGNGVLQLVGIILVVKTFFRTVPIWMRVLHCLYLTAAIVFYAVTFYIASHLGDGLVL